MRIMEQGQATFPSIPACCLLATRWILVHQGPPCHTTTALLPRFHLRCDEPNVINTCLVADVEHIRYCREIEGWIAFDEHDLLCPCSKDAFQLIQYISVGNVQLIDLVAWTSSPGPMSDLDDDSAVIVLLLLRF